MGHGGRASRPNKAVEPTAPMVALWHAGAVHGAAAHRGRSALRAGGNNPKTRRPAHTADPTTACAREAARRPATVTPATRTTPAPLPSTTPRAPRRSRGWDARGRRLPQVCQRTSRAAREVGPHRRALQRTTMAQRCRSGPAPVTSAWAPSTTEAVRCRARGVAPVRWAQRALLPSAPCGVRQQEADPPSLWQPRHDRAVRAEGASPPRPGATVTARPRVAQTASPTAP